jgi:N-acetylneuraminic acid mutarotase
MTIGKSIYKPLKIKKMKSNYIILKLNTVLLVLVFLGLHFNAFSQEHGWEQMESMNTARINPASCVIDNKIYVFGGYTSGSTATASVEIYDIENNEWTVAKNMELAMATTCSGMINNKIYIMGGWAEINGQWQALNTNLEYDYETDSYLEKQPTLMNIGFGASCIYDSLIYTFGGMSMESNVNLVKSWIYDPYTDTWDSICDMKFRHEGAAQVINNNIYVIGGAESTVINGQVTGKITGKVEMYDPDGDIWEEKAEIPHPVSDHISVVHNGKILVFGGDTGFWGPYNSTGSNLIQEYDPAENKWYKKHGMQFKRATMTGQKVGKYVYIIGGLENGRIYNEPVFSEVWRFNLDSLKPYDPAIDPFLPTGVEENKISNYLTLHQNYPNPFREYTQIKYDLHREGIVKLQVFNFLGQEVTTLVNKYQKPGSYEVIWNAEEVKPGIYFIKLKAGDFEKTNKAIVY